jgi:hypothetical protein
VSDQDPPLGADVPGDPGGEPAAVEAPPPAARPVKKRAVKKKAASSRAGTNKPPPVDDAKAAMRGYAVIAVTLIVGAVIFWKGLQGNTASTVDASKTTTTLAASVSTIDRNAAPSTTRPEQGTTVPPAAPSTSVPPASLKVMVANGVDPAQTIAGPAASTLKAADYGIAGTVDLTPSGLAASAVYYNDGYQGDATAVAKELGISSSAVQPMPAQPPTSLNGANVLVVIGKDKA